MPIAADAQAAVHAYVAQFRGFCRDRAEVLVAAVRSGTL